MFKRFSWMLLALAVVAMPTIVDAKGGSGGGGGGGTVADARVTGYITAIDSANKVIMVGQSYYGSGAIKINDATQIQVNGESVNFSDLVVGDWAEARYVVATRTATKIEVTR